MMILLCYRKLLRNVPITQKGPPGRIALRRRGIMSLKRPAAGGESYKVGFFLAKNHDKRVKSCYNKNKKRRARICV
jgi:hypothetical protein